MSLADPMVKVVIPDGNSSLFDVVVNARAKGMHVVTNGKMIVVCSVVPAGWRRMNWLKERPTLDNGGYPPCFSKATMLPSPSGSVKIGHEIS